MTVERRPPGRIFINYRRDDTAGIAGRLADTLDRYFGRGRVFRDIDGIETGANFEDVLRNTAEAADAMVVLIGPDWLTATDRNGAVRLQDPDDWVAREIAAALARGIPIYPVLVESAAMPRASELPESLRGLVRHNAMSISDQRWRSDVERLAKVVALDMPASLTQTRLLQAQVVISAALVLAVAGTCAWIARNHLRGEPLLSLAVSGVTFVVISGCVVLLLFIVRMVDESRRLYIHLAWATGLLGTFVSFLSLDVDDKLEPLTMACASTSIAITMLALMGLSGFKAR